VYGKESKPPGPIVRGGREDGQTTSVRELVVIPTADNERNRNLRLWRKVTTSRNLKIGMTHSGKVATSKGYQGKERQEGKVWGGKGGVL